MDLERAAALRAAVRGVRVATPAGAAGVTRRSFVYDADDYFVTDVTTCAERCLHCRLCLVGMWRDKSLMGASSGVLTQGPREDPAGPADGGVAVKAADHAPDAGSKQGTVVARPGAVVPDRYSCRGVVDAGGGGRTSGRSVRRGVIPFPFGGQHQLVEACPVRVHQVGVAGQPIRDHSGGFAGLRADAVVDGGVLELGPGRPGRAGFAGAGPRQAASAAAGTQRRWQQQQRSDRRATAKITAVAVDAVRVAPSRERSRLPTH